MSKNWQAKPSVVSRASWGAAPTGCSTRLSSVNQLVVHHCVYPNSTINSNTERQHQKQIQHGHMNDAHTLFCDIGYH
ncbi:hypothetical protein [Alkalihalobacillus sp. LMS39]|uniref:hypothetical protein n=1 Tax=Alkalihalobacillus sp. LMS39 TaxID=2924032 RepID=UPI001FB2B767|nr:hypothetical protein [Alkalihalobacillus sp. LMS39]UOE94101.1 hypothetical protein MM271_23510 [Alkalihalobacillus sp. LMS39]